MANQQYIEELFNTMGHLRKLLESQAQESHIDRAATIMQFFALKFLSSNKNSTVGEVAQHLKLSKSSATQLVERLVKANFVKRTQDTTDRRIVHITITSDGQAEISKLKKKFLDKMGKIFSKIPDNDLKTLIRIHTDLIATLQKEQTN